MLQECARTCMTPWKPHFSDVAFHARHRQVIRLAIVRPYALLISNSSQPLLSGMVEVVRSFLPMRPVIQWWYDRRALIRVIYRRLR